MWPFEVAVWGEMDPSSQKPSIWRIALPVGLAIAGAGGAYTFVKSRPAQKPAPASEISVSKAAADAGISTASISGRNVLLIILDDVGAQEIRSYANDLATATRTVSSSTGIIDSNTNYTPDGLEDRNADTYADGAIATPTIDKLATAGVRFTQVWANPLCSPTRAGIYTGLYASHHGVGAPIGTSTMVTTLPSDILTLPEQLDAAGSKYATGLFGKWHLGATAGMYPTDRGWDYFSGNPDGEVADYSAWTKVVVDNAAGTSSTTASTTYVTSDTIESTLTWIGKRTTPWWATVALNAAHTQSSGSSYTDPPSTCLSGTITGSTDTAKYHKIIECADYYIGNMLSRISSETLANTTIIILGDNGSEGGITEVSSTNRSKGSAYQGGVHVPLIIADGTAYSGASGTALSRLSTGHVASAGRTVAYPVNTVDLFATMAAIMHVTPSSTDSVSLVDYLNSSSTAALRSYSVTETFAYASALAVSRLPSGFVSADVAALTKGSVKATVRGAQYKLVYSSSAGTYEFYDLSVDPFEQNNIWCPVTGTSVAVAIAMRALVAQLQAVDSTYPSYVSVRASCKY